MTNVRHIRLVALLIVAFVTLFSSECRAAVVSEDYTHTTATPTDRGTVIAEYNPNTIAIATSNSTPQTITPAVRTIHSVTHNAERTTTHNKASTAIDGTTTTTRYGLYNHKILFVSIARYHYVCRLRRLII